MWRTIAIIITIFILCLGSDNCKSSEAPEDPTPEYIFGVEVIYTREEAALQGRQDSVFLYYELKDQPPRPDDLGLDEMENIWRTNKFRGFLPKVYVQTHRYPDKHKVYVRDHAINCSYAPGENIGIKGAYDLEIKKIEYSENCFHYYLYFKMSKE
jgi:hypothetical protein